MAPKKRNPRHLAAPPKFPCGCSAGTTAKESNRVLRNRDGTRTCECGRRWKLKWDRVSNSIPVGSLKEASK